MITWWSIYPIYLASIFPFIIAAIPTIPNKIAIGGMFRQWLANKYLILLPDDKVFAYHHFFMEGQTLDEFIAVIPMLVALTALTVWGAFLLGTAIITVHNAVVKRTQKSIIDAHR